MNELEKTEKTSKKENERDLTVDPVDIAGTEAEPIKTGLRERVWKLFSGARQRGAGTRQELAKDRTRSFVLLIGGVVGAVLLFMGLLSTPTVSPIQEAGSHGTPNLGRRAASNETMAPRTSVTPLLNADVQSNEADSDQLTPADIRGTSQRASGSDETKTPSETSGNDIVQNNSASRSDPLAAYRLNNGQAPTYTYAGPHTATAKDELPTTYRYNVDGSLLNETHLDTPGSLKSSIVFVRSPDMSEGAKQTRSGTTARLEATALLPPGTRLVARLEAAATTAVKTPLIASIEYNYEREGMIIVPAGTTAVGDVQQASSEGYLDIHFHTLRMPDGREEKIEATAVGLDQKPLKGAVSGKNAGKTLLSRSLSGVGTIAAYAVGAGGAGLNRTLTGETLLRDRLAGNIALAGEQELTNAAYSQNISVTVPANTRFYVILQKEAGSTIPPTRTRTESNAQSVELPTVQELRELMDLRREINRLYQESNGSSTGGLKR